MIYKDSISKTCTPLFSNWQLIIFNFHHFCIKTIVFIRSNTMINKNTIIMKIYFPTQFHFNSVL